MHGDDDEKKRDTSVRAVKENTCFVDMHCGSQLSLCSCFAFAFTTRRNTYYSIQVGDRNRHVLRTCMGTFLKARSTNIHPMEDSVACSRQVLIFGGDVESLAGHCV